MTTLPALEDKITHAALLRNALRIIKKRSNGVPTWGTVTEICCTGSGHAIQICYEIGVDPHAPRYTEIEAVQ